MTMPACTRTETLVSIENVGLTFGGRDILDGVTAKINNLHRADDNGKTGQVVAFLGPSGRGKTQLLRILAGLQAPTRGGVFLGAERQPTHAGLVGLVSQNYLLYRNRTVLGNLEIAARQKVRDRKAAWHAAYDMLTSLGLGTIAQLYPSQISGGQRQRVAIGQQLLCSEHFLLMDEPTTGLDPIAKAKVCALVTDVANQDDLNNVVMVTHDIQSAIAVADTLWLLGYDRNRSGTATSGARIQKEFDLIERGLPWQPDVQMLPAFRDVEREVLELFKTL